MNAIYAYLILIGLSSVIYPSKTTATQTQRQHLKQYDTEVHHKPLASCIVNLCSQQPCYFEINWLSHSVNNDVYTTRYRKYLKLAEKAQVLQTEYGIGDQADFIEAPLDLPFNQGKWPRLHFAKNENVNKVTVINHHSDAQESL